MLTSLLLLIVLFAAAQQKIPYSISKQFEGSNGAVVSAHPLASEAGLLMLKQGGNAVDAAIATQLALAVVYPGAGNLGGGGFMVATLSNGSTVAIDYREKAPGRSHRDMYLDSAGNPITDLSLEGPLASGVPGTVAGLVASMKYGKLSMKKLIAPAILLAEKGFAITESQARSFNANKKEFLKNNKNKTAFVKDGQWKEGDLLIQPELAATLRRISSKGMNGFYKGATAKLIVEEMKRGNGIISLADLKNYRAKERTATRFDYKGYEVIGMPMPSSGGLLLEQMMKMVRDRKLGAMGFQTAESVQLMIEAERRAFADRGTYMGDADFVKVPVDALRSEAYLQQRMADYKPGIAGSSSITKEGIVAESEETTHLSVVDKDGNAVAVTTTLNGGYGSYTVVSGAGFLLNNEMDDFSVKPGAPNMYGAVGKAANAIAPGKRMLSSMTPTIVLKDKKPYIIVGTPGGTTIPTSVFQTLVNLLEFNMSPADAVNKPKFHHQWLPDMVYIEKGFDKTTTDELQKMGYKLGSRGAIGRVELIVLTQQPNRKIIAVADDRGDDSAAGY
ncbi:MAG: gamma-glutamyltransferase [Chitinophagaceae bacterium]|nr:MAG: gamma-glutamyltransferase [Chitinophagaceae bacterium]